MARPAMSRFLISSLIATLSWADYIYIVQQYTCGIQGTSRGRTHQVSDSMVRIGWPSAPPHSRSFSFGMNFGSRVGEQFGGVPVARLGEFCFRHFKQGCHILQNNVDVSWMVQGFF